MHSAQRRHVPPQACYSRCSVIHPAGDYNHRSYFLQNQKPVIRMERSTDFLGSNLEQAAQRLFKTEPIDQQFIRPQRGVDADLSLRSKLFSSNLLFELLRMPAAKQLLLEIVFSGP
jgi:hypothetical protein